MIRRHILLFIVSLKITPNIDKSAVVIEAHTPTFQRPGTSVVRVEVYDGKKRVGNAEVNTVEKLAALHRELMAAKK